MKAILMSFQPTPCSLIANGEKTDEVRKRRPKIETPFKVYMYATKSGDRLVIKNNGVFEISKTITGKLIHLCFTCDPYPKGYDNAPTREIIKILKGSGNNVQILTKNGVDAMRDFDLLDSNDWFGVTYAGYQCEDFDKAPYEEKGAGTPLQRLIALDTAHKQGIKTWVSAEPVLNATDVLELIALADYIDLWKVGKLNYHPSSIDWKDFGRRAERALQAKRKTYYIKDSLRAEMVGESK